MVVLNQKACLCVSFSRSCGVCSFKCFDSVCGEGGFFWAICFSGIPPWSSHTDKIRSHFAVPVGGCILDLIISLWLQTSLKIIYLGSFCKKSGDDFDVKFDLLALLITFVWPRATVRVDEEQLQCSLKTKRSHI